MSDHPSAPPAGTSDDVSPTVDAVTVYWRPGCGFCSSLLRVLSHHDIPLELHNIWEDESAAAVVRSIANGNETVPTVVVGEIAMVNPSYDEVVLACSAQAPHLVPQGWTPPEPSRVGRALRRLLGGE